MQERLNDAKRRMEGAGRSLASEFATVRTGRASTALLDRVMVDAYGTRTPLNQLAGVNTPESRLITVQPYDSGIIGLIEKALLESDIGLTPNSDGKIIRLPVPMLTEERRKELTKVVRHEAENARIAVRNLRRDAIHALKEALKKKEISENDERKAHDDVQKATDRHIEEIDKLLQQKETELMAV